MKKIYKYLFSILIGGALLSCADDNIINDTPQWQEGDTPYYIKLKLRSHSDSFTRADNNVPGSGGNPEFATDEEYAIGEKGNFAIFFDGDGKYISWSDLYSVNPTTDENGVVTTTEGMDATYTCRFYGFTDREPKKVLVVVNASDKIYKQVTTFPGWTLDEVYKQIWEECGKLDRDKYNKEGIAEYEDDPYNNLGFRIEGDTRYFTMTNTTYVESAGTDKAKIHCAEDIVQVTTNQGGLKDLIPTTVYLERMVSKFSLSLSFDPSEYNPVSKQNLDVCFYNEDGNFTYLDVPWTIKMLSWGMNGLETQSYLFKNLPDVNGDWIYHSGWNYVTQKYGRSFWSLDPHYYKDETKQVVYPWQFDYARDKYDLEYQHWYEYFHSYDGYLEDGASITPTFALTYYPLTHFCPGIIDENGQFSSNYAYQGDSFNVYTPENTFVPAMQVDRSRGTRAYELAGTHLLLLSKLNIDESAVTEKYFPLSENIYRNRVGVTYLREIDMFEDFMNAMNYKFTSQKRIYYKYYPWDDEEISDKRKDDYKKGTFRYGTTFRAISEGPHSLFYYNEEEKEVRELTYKEILNLKKNPTNYSLIKDADAINADGKVIPWVMYRKNAKDKFKSQKLMILENIDLENDQKDGFIYIDEDTDGIIIKGDITDKNSPAYKYVHEKKIRFQKDNGTTDSSGNFINNWVDFDEDERDNNDIQSLFYEIWGVADCYNNGLMYYAVPIYGQEYNGDPALGRDREIQGNDSGIDDISFYYYYGVVRNNWYDFKIHSIQGIGIPISVPEKPIVPNYINKKDQVKVEMEIIPMHIEEIDVPI